MNLITTAALKAIGVRRIICKALSTRQKDILLSIGASEVIQPEADAGHQLALELAAPNLLDRIPLGDKHTILELMVTSSMHEKTLVDADFRKLYDVSVMAIKRENDITISPSGDFLMQEGDILVVLGEVDKITNLEELT